MASPADVRAHVDAVAARCIAQPLRATAPTAEDFTAARACLQAALDAVAPGHHVGPVSLEDGRLVGGVELL